MAIPGALRGKSACWSGVESSRFPLDTVTTELAERIAEMK
jgi:hypothetical protein